MIRLLIDPFAAPYMRRALVEVVVLGLLFGAVSVHVLLRRLAFMGDALTHTVFPGIAIAFALGQSLFLGALVAATLSVALVTLLTRMHRVDSDAALGALTGTFFAVGVIVISARPSYTSDIASLLFGRLLNTGSGQIRETLIVAAAVLTVLALLHKELILRAFDPVASEALGYRPLWLDLLLSQVVALVVVAAGRAVGPLLAIALLIIPAATARLLTVRVGSLVTGSIVVAVFGGYAGLVATYSASTRHGLEVKPSAAIVLALAGCFLAAGALSALWRGRSPVGGASTR